MRFCCTVARPHKPKLALTQYTDVSVCSWNIVHQQASADRGDHIRPQGSARKLQALTMEALDACSKGDSPRARAALAELGKRCVWLLWTPTAMNRAACRAYMRDAQAITKLFCIPVRSSPALTPMLSRAHAGEIARLSTRSTQRPCIGARLSQRARPTCCRNCTGHTAVRSGSAFQPCSWPRSRCTTILLIAQCLRLPMANAALEPGRLTVPCVFALLRRPISTPPSTPRWRKSSGRRTWLWSPWN